MHIVKHSRNDVCQTILTAKKIISADHGYIVAATSIPL